MTDNHASLVRDLLESSHSRSHFLKGSAVIAAALGVAPAVADAAPLAGGGVGGGKGGGAMPESVSSILNIAATAEALAVTALYNVHQAVNRGQLATQRPDVPKLAVSVNTLVAVVRAALREEQDHLAFLMGAGARPLLTSFTLPPNIFRVAADTLAFFEIAETLFIGAYMAAVREFANGGLGTLAQYAYQIGGVEAEHRVLMRAALGEMPPNNKSFETPLFNRVADAANELAKLGLLKPSMPYPGAGAVDQILSSTFSHDATAGVTQRHP